MKDGDIIKELEGFDAGRQLAVIKKLGGKNGLEAFLRDELVVVEKNKTSIVSGNSLNGGISFAVPVPQVPDPKLFLDEMAEFYGKVYNIAKLPKVSLPIVVPGFCWGLVMVPGITIEQDLAACQKDYEVWRWTEDNLDNIVKSTRSADKPYAIWLRDRQEADQELKNKSFNDLEKLGIPGITLAERIRLERWFFWRTNEHLDIQNVTLCTGSRSSDGDVPGVDWDSDFRRLSVSWCGSGDADSGLRSRQAVS